MYQKTAFFCASSSCLLPPLPLLSPLFSALLIKPCLTWLDVWTNVCLSRPQVPRSHAVTHFRISLHSQPFWDSRLHRSRISTLTTTSSSMPSIVFAPNPLALFAAFLYALSCTDLNRCTLTFCTGHVKSSSPVLTGPRPPTSVQSCQDQRPDRRSGLQLS
jgi:hypothetical protein